MPDLQPSTVATVSASAREQVVCHDSLLESLTNCSAVDSRRIAPVRERGWLPGDYCSCQKCFPLKTSLLLVTLPETLLVREHSMSALGRCSVVYFRFRFSTESFLRTV
jgi:hypothetical protein